jgi:hypothetical protein
VRACVWLYVHVCVCVWAGGLEHTVVNHVTECVIAVAAVRFSAAQKLPPISLRGCIVMRRHMIMISQLAFDIGLGHLSEYTKH